MSEDDYDESQRKYDAHVAGFVERMIHRQLTEFANRIRGEGGFIALVPQHLYEPFDRHAKTLVRHGEVCGGPLHLCTIMGDVRMYSTDCYDATPTVVPLAKPSHVPAAPADDRE